LTHSLKPPGFNPWNLWNDDIVVSKFAFTNWWSCGRYTEGFRWCQNLHLGERPARFTAVGMQLGSALGALISFFLF
jgi:hypothetical protein